MVHDPVSVRALGYLEPSAGCALHFPRLWRQQGDRSLLMNTGPANPIAGRHEVPPGSIVGLHCLILRREFVADHVWGGQDILRSGHSWLQQDMGGRAGGGAIRRRVSPLKWEGIWKARLTTAEHQGYLWCRALSTFSTAIWEGGINSLACMWNQGTG